MYSKKMIHSCIFLLTCEKKIIYFVQFRMDNTICLLHIIYSYCSIRERVILKTMILKNNLSADMLGYKDESLSIPSKYLDLKYRITIWKRFVQYSKSRRKTRSNSWFRKQRNREDIPVSMWIPF